MAHRTFTLDEANAALRALRPLAERIVELRVDHRAALERLAALRARIGSNGGGLDAADVAEAEAEAERLQEAIAGCIEQIAEAGAQVKDLDLGLLDFPSVRDGREVLLCWRVGEPEIAYWHDADEGFAGRKRLPEDE